MKKWLLYCLILMISVVLAACGGDNGNEGAQNGGNDPNVEQTGFDDNNDTDLNNNGNNALNNGDNGNNANGNGEDQYELAEKAADKISNQVNGVDQAYVLKTDNNAYVAVELERNNDGENGDANNNGNNGNDNGTATNNGNNNAENNNGVNGQNNGLTDRVKEEISRIVKSVDKDVENVYVSTNPDFFNLAGNYADDAGNGEPIEGIFDQLGNMIQRVFPDNPAE